MHRKTWVPWQVCIPGRFGLSRMQDESVLCTCTGCSGRRRRVNGSSGMINDTRLNTGRQSDVQQQRIRLTHLIVLIWLQGFGVP